MARLPDDSPWRRLRRRNRLAWAFFLASPLVVMGLGVPLSKLVGSETPIPVMFAAWMGVLHIASHRVARFPCPRCGKPFFQAQWYYNSFAQRCVHCGLPKWSDDYTAQGASPGHE